MIGKRSNSVLIGMVLLSSIVACNEANLDSNWKATAFSSDSPDSVWATSSVYSLEGKDISIGLQNDSDYLYILLRAADRQTQAKIMRAGLIVWLDPAGKKNNKFGIHYPLGMQAHGAFQFPRDRQNEIGGEEQRERFMGMPDTMEVLGPGKTQRKMVPIKSDLGLAVSTSDNAGTITYELRVPLKTVNSSDYVLNPVIGKPIGIGLETGAFEPRERPNGEMRPRGEGGDRGGFGGRGGMGGHGMGGPRGKGPGGDEQGNSFEPLKFWGRIILASSSNNQG